MVSDRDALFHAICQHPEEDTPRLMYADWLEENGEADRAEFIRIQCELAQLATDDSGTHPVYEFLRDRDFVTRKTADWTQIDDGIHKRLALTIRENDLHKRNLEAWTPRLRKPESVTWLGFRRGFPYSISLAKRKKLKSLGQELREQIPPFHLICHNFTAEFVEELAQAKLLDRIVGLDIEGEAQEGLRELGSRPESRNLRILWVVGSERAYEEEPELPAVLADCRHFKALYSLLIGNSSYTDDSLLKLFSAPQFQTLRDLSIFTNDWQPYLLRALGGAGYTELRSLRLIHSNINDAGAEHLANSPAFANLQKLELERNSIGGRGVSALLASPHLRKLSYLGVGNNPVHHLDAKLLANAEPAGLRMFHAHGCQLRAADVRALARCPRMRTLWYLDLDDNHLWTAALRELVRGFGKWCPPILWLTHNHIDHRGAEVLANWKAAKQLRVLHLKYNYQMNPDAVRALLDSPNLVNLDSFAVSTGDEELQQRIAARFPREPMY